MSRIGWITGTNVPPLSNLMAAIAGEDAEFRALDEIILSLKDTHQALLDEIINAAGLEPSQRRLLDAVLQPEGRMKRFQQLTDLLTVNLPHRVYLRACDDDLAGTIWALVCGRPLSSREGVTPAHAATGAGCGFGGGVIEYAIRYQCRGLAQVRRKSVKTKASERRCHESGASRHILVKFRAERGAGIPSSFAGEAEGAVAAASMSMALHRCARTVRLAMTKPLERKPHETHDQYDDIDDRG